MSFKALKYVSQLLGLTPNQKLAMFQLASMQNEQSHLCNPSPEHVAYTTGMSASQVRIILNQLISLNLLERSSKGWSFPNNIKMKGDKIPINWWPSERALETLTECYPNHHFNIEEAVNEFIAFCHDKEITHATDRIDAAFVRNISQILDHRKSGSVQIARDREDTPRSKVNAFFD